ncbi:MAG: formate/nitrite transporter family protein [Dictyoglomaceae bacterium]
MTNGIKTPKEITENLVENISIYKANLSFWKMVWLGILAGVYISFGGQLMNIVSCDLGSKISLGFSRFLGGSVFSVGLMLVVIAGAELFTGNTLMLAGLVKKKITIGKLLRNWIVVYLSNFIGSLFIVYLIYFSGQWKIGDGLVGANTLKIALSKVNLSWIEAFTRGILANWLVCLAVWMSYASQDIIGKIFAIYFPIMAFVASGFEHSIANMYLIPIGLFLKNEPLVLQTIGNVNLSNLTWGRFIWNNLIPVTLGNIIGGALLVGVIYAYIYYDK